MSKNKKQEKTWTYESIVRVYGVWPHKEKINISKEFINKTDPIEKKQIKENLENSKENLNAENDYKEAINEIEQDTFQ